jgi:DNA-binding transcriptional ArsR family regulator
MQREVRFVLISLYREVYLYLIKKVRNMKTKRPKIKPKRVELAADRLRAINHQLRIKIIHFIHETEETSVSNLYHQLKLEQSVASQHLRILRDARLVTTRRDGKFILYSLDYDQVEKVVKVANELARIYRQEA